MEKEINHTNGGKQQRGHADTNILFKTAAGSGKEGGGRKTDRDKKDKSTNEMTR